MYKRTATIKNYESLRTATLWAGWLGVVQSLIWIGLTITGIVAYNCLIYVTNYLSFGSLIRTVFFDLYFHGPCSMEPSDYQNYNRTMLLSVHTVLDPEGILVWECVYLAVAVCWLIASVVILTYVDKKCIKQTLTCLLVWILFTFAICLMDLALGIIFGMDYGLFAARARKYNANSVNVGEIIPDASQLVAATVVSMSLMIISLKGFVMWIINFGLLIYLFVRAVIIMNMDSSITLFMPPQASNDVLANNNNNPTTPIRAYEEIQVQAYSNNAYEPDRNRGSVEAIEVNEEAIVRAAHMSRDANYMDRRFRNLDAYQQYPAPNNNNTRPQRQVQETVVVASAGFPAPDYSPVGSPNNILRPHQY